MAKFSSASAFYFILVLFIVASVEVSKVPMVEARDCYSAWPNCTDLAACKHRCAEMYHGQGFCYDMPGTYIRQCKCQYPC